MVREVNQGRTVFSQSVGFRPNREFRRCVARYDGDGRDDLTARSDMRDFIARIELKVTNLQKGPGRQVPPSLFERWRTGADSQERGRSVAMAGLVPDMQGQGRKA